MRYSPEGTATAVDASLVDLLQHRAAEMAEKRAFSFLRGHDGGAVELTYAGLDRRARAIAQHLRTLAQPGDRALLLFPPGIDFVPAFFGCLYAGIVAVPVAPPGRNRMTSPIEAVYDACSPALILSTADHCQQAPEAYSKLSKLLSRPWVAIDTLPDAAADDWSRPTLTPDDTAFLQYTSGSTSQPKGVMLSHGNLLANAEMIRKAFGNSTDSSAVFWLPLYHDMGLIGGVIQPVYCGGSCTLLAPAAFLQRPALWLETISKERATVSGGPDFAFDLCARKVSPEERQALDLSCWNVAFMGAERIRAQTLERFVKAFEPCGFRREALFPCYGLAEATLMVSGGPQHAVPQVIHVDAEALALNRVREAASDDEASRSLVACGEGLADQHIVIVDPQTHEPVADDEVGEIWVDGPSVARGYFQRPDATEAAFGARVAGSGAGPFLRTGDLGFLREGQLFVTGRVKDLIIIRGRNFYPEDIEHSVERAFEAFRPGFCAAFSVEIEDREHLVVVQEIEPRCRQLDRDAAVQAIRSAIARRHELEIHAIVLAKAGTIPKTSSGKTRRSACRERFLTGQLEAIFSWKADPETLGGGVPRPHCLTAPRPMSVEEIERWLTERIASRLQLSRAQVLASTPFLEFGMGSMDAVEIAADLGQWLGRRLSPTAIYNYPNIAALAQWLAHPPAALEASAGVEVSRLLTADADPEQLLDEVRGMSEADIKAFLVQEMAKQEGGGSA